jgi:hypothetical protein
MDEIKFIQNLDAKARAEPQPLRMDVADRVIETLRSPKQNREPLRLEAPAGLWLATGLSWAAAAASLLIAIQSLTQLQDPFSDLFNPLTMVLR